MIKDGLTYDDVLLVPQYSNIKSRSDVDISVKINDLKFNHPIVPANMKNICGRSMAIEILLSGGLAILHRFMPIQDQINIAKDMTNAFPKGQFAVSVGVKPEDKENISKFLEAGVKIFCIDIAHGDSEHCVDMTKYIRAHSEHATIIAGNVATRSAAIRLWEAGADILKVGIGPGALCSTRTETGNGVPQLTALMEVAQAKQQMKELQRTQLIKRQFYLIADGGIKNSGDIVKALCFADMVMTGNLFAGSAEAPGNIITMDGIQYKEYAGSSTHKDKHIEGVSALVPCKGKYQEILSKLLEGLRSGCSYQGAHNLTELKDNPEFIKMTSAGLQESHPHDVRIIK